MNATVTRDPLEQYRRLFAALEKLEVNYILVGGLAVLLHGFARFTEDVDLLIDPRPGNVERLKRALREALGGADVEEIGASDFEDYAVVRYVAGDSLVVDLIARIGEVADFSTVDWEFVDLDGIKVRVATPEALLRLKEGSLRPKDQQDVLFLRRLLGK